MMHLIPYNVIELGKHSIMFFKLRVWGENHQDNNEITLNLTPRRIYCQNSVMFLVP